MEISESRRKLECLLTYLFPEKLECEECNGMSR